jgi:hypothetical protein
MAVMSPRLAPDAVRGMLKARDPFELIRWLAYSQPDPRKALAELVQNSLDAAATIVRITRFTEGGRPALRIFDDGLGVIPEMERRDALQYVATQIGHSRKRHLSPQERLSLMTQGQYGIGLLGFWSLGDRLEMRSALPGGRPHRLVLYRDRPGYLVEPLREHLPLGDRFTEIVVSDLDEGAVGATGGRRTADWLAAELRGQLLARRVDVEIEDRLARGGAGKVIRVKPAPLPGRPIAGIAELSVPEGGTIRLDVGLWDGPPDGCPGIALYAGGTRVAERLTSLAVLGLDRAPWSDSRLTGSVEYGHLRVPPGSREGVLPDAAAVAFAEALRAIEPRIAGALDEAAAAETERAERVMVRDLRTAFEGIARRRPGLALLPVEEKVSGTFSSQRSPDTALQRKRCLTPGLLPPGPLAGVVVSPDAIAVPRGGRVTLRASCRDALGCEIDRPASVRWSAEGAYATIVAGDDDPRIAVLHVADEAGTGTITVAATSDGCGASCLVGYEVLAHAVARDGRDGVPDPVWVEDDAGRWRTRRVEGRWEINAAHPDWCACEGPAAKLRYVTLLLAREVALANAGPSEPAMTTLERVIELVSEADARLSARATGRSRSSSARPRSPRGPGAPSNPPLPSP